MKRTALKRTRSTKLDFSTATKELISERAFSRCEVASVGCRGGIHHFHHRRLRAQGGSGTEANGLAVCGPCHTLIHMNPDWSYRHGLLVRAYEKAETVASYLGCATNCEENHTGQ